MHDVIHLVDDVLPEEYRALYHNENKRVSFVDINGVKYPIHYITITRDGETYVIGISTHELEDKLFADGNHTKYVSNDAKIISGNATSEMIRNGRVYFYVSHEEIFLSDDELKQLVLKEAK